MNTPDNDLPARLRTAFEHEAESVPEVDLAAGVASRARRTRRRQRAVGAAAVVVVAAVVSVSVLTIGDLTGAESAPAPADQSTEGPRPTESTPPDTEQTDATEPDATPLADEPETQIRMAQLPAGEAPNLPYVRDRQWYDGGSNVDLADQPFTTIPFGEHVYAVYTNHDGQQSYSVDAGRPEVLFYGTWYGDAIAGPNDSIMWFTTDAFDNTSDNATRPDNPTLHTLTVDASGSVQMSTASFGDLDDAVVTLVGFVGDDVVASVEPTRSGGAGYVIRFPASDPSEFQQVGDFAAVTAVDRGAELMAVLTPGKGSGGSECSSVVDADTNQARWSSCSWAPVTFSPDGSRVYADAINARGADADRHAVLDAETGDVLLVLLVAGRAGYLDSAVFEGNEALLVSVDRFPPRSPAVNAIVRCAISSGDCETATPPQQLISGDDYVFDNGAAPSGPSYE